MTVSGTALKPFKGKEGSVQEGDKFGDGEKFPALDKRRAAKLQELKLFVPDQEQKSRARAAVRKTASATKRPLAGGQKNGKARQSLSSPVGRQRKQRRSRK